jgi:hypothetical protein
MYTYFILFAGSDETKMDEVAMMLGIAVFVLHASSEVVSAPNLQFPCINHFRHAFQSENLTVSKRRKNKILFISVNLVK